MLLQKGNRKLPKTTLIFNLPAIKTCPKSTPECRKWCYARKAEKQYPQVLPYRNKCFEASKDKYFTDFIIREINQHINNDRIKPTHVRIHESGDFYDEDYFFKWVRIAKQLPNIIFYCYTKTVTAKFWIDELLKPKNLIVLYSDDEKKETIDEIKNIKYDGRARVDDGRKLTKNEFMCPGDCKTCDYCYDGKGFKQVVFKKH